MREHIVSGGMQGAAFNGQGSDIANNRSKGKEELSSALFTSDYARSLELGSPAVNTLATVEFGFLLFEELRASNSKDVATFFEQIQREAFGVHCFEEGVSYKAFRVFCNEWALKAHQLENFSEDHAVLRQSAHLPRRSSDALREIFREKFRIGKERENRLVGLLDNFITRSGPELHKIMEDSATVAGFSNRLDAIMSAGPKYLSTGQKVELAKSAVSSEPEELGRYMAAVQTIDFIPLNDKQGKYSNQLIERFKSNAALLPARFSDEPIGLPHFAVIDVFNKLFRTEDVIFHQHFGDNDARIIDSVYKGIKTGKMTIKSLSCPDYSGYETDGVWSYDFRSLRDGEGICALKGYKPVATFMNVLRDWIPKVEFHHFQPSFEVIDGFCGTSGSEDSRLGRDDAIAILRRSNNKIAARYREIGIDVYPFLTDEIVPDSTFKSLKQNTMETLLHSYEEDAGVRKLFSDIFRGRKLLYSAWYPQRQDEDAVTYENRIKREVIPGQVAEYIIVGKALTEDGDSILLAYDSPIMGEVHPHFGIPAIFAVGKQSLNYVGA